MTKLAQTVYTDTGGITKGIKRICEKRSTKKVKKIASKITQRHINNNSIERSASMT